MKLKKSRRKSNETVKGAKQMTEYWTVWKVQVYLGNIPKTTVLRWEKEGVIPKAKRHPVSKYRYWTAEDIKKMEALKKLLLV